MTISETVSGSNSQGQEYQEVSQFGRPVNFFCEQYPEVGDQSE